MLELNLPTFDCKIKKKDSRLYIWDLVRKKYIMLTPEEWVRQHFVNYLITGRAVPLPLISLEHAQSYNSLDKRSDIVVWNRKMEPLLLVECKASHVSLSSETLFQLNTYNSTLKAPFIAITNGMQHFYFSREENAYKAVKELPEIGEWL